MKDNIPLWSKDIKEDTLKQLKGLVPHVFREGKIDLEEIKRYFDGEIDQSTERYKLTWAGRKEAFDNLKQSTSATLIPIKSDSINFKNTKNIFIEGDNLEVLKILQGAYYNRIKLIFIDPPYNTGKNFIYNDKFDMTLSSYLEQTGQIEEGKKKPKNPETSGRFHSDWLTFMYPRLFLSRYLLKENGLIFITIDDHEVHNLRRMMDEIYGEENFMGTIVWNSTKSVTNTALISVSHTYILIYAKNKDYYTKRRYEFRLPPDEEYYQKFSNPDNDPRGPWVADPFQVGGWRPNQQYEVKNPNTGVIYAPNEGCSWKNDYNKFQKLLEEDRIVFGLSGEAGPQRKRFLSEAKKKGLVSKTWWDDIDTTTHATVHLKELFGDKVFDSPKPVELIERIIELGTVEEDDIILDFFAGSGTTAEAVFNHNKKFKKGLQFILIQLPEPIDKKTIAYKNGFRTISEITKERISKIIGEMHNSISRNSDHTKKDLGFKVFELHKTHFKNWLYEVHKKNITPDDALEILEKWANQPSINEDIPDLFIVYELLIKERYDLNSIITEIDIFDSIFYNVGDKSSEKDLYISLEKNLTPRCIKALIKGEYDDARFIIRESALDDSTKINLNNSIKLKVF